MLGTKGNYMDLNQEGEQLFKWICSFIRSKPMFEIKYRNDESLFFEYESRTYHIFFEDCTDEIRIRKKNKLFLYSQKRRY